MKSPLRTLAQRASSSRNARLSSRFGRGRRMLRMEALEGRSLLALLVADVIGGSADTTIGGTVIEDLDANGQKNGGENGIPNWTVFLDLDNSGTLNRDAAGDLEPSAVTNQDGDYVIDHLQPGTYTVSHVLPPGWRATGPLSQEVEVFDTKDSVADFFVKNDAPTTGGISGTVWNDLDGDGVRDTDPDTGAFTDPGLEGWTIFLDLNNSRSLDLGEPSTFTNVDGNYAFSDLAPGDYEVFEILPDGWDVSPTFDNKQTVAVVGGANQVARDFANIDNTNGSIEGTVWNDLNANGIRDIDPDTLAFTDPGLEGWTIYLDMNNNLSLDPGEPTALTDANGHYVFTGLLAGDYEVTEVLPSGWNVSPTFDQRQTVTAEGGVVKIADDFANFGTLNGSIRGTVWNDVNANGIRDAGDVGLVGWTIYLDLNRNDLLDASDEPSALTDAAGNYSFTELQIGEYEVREVLPMGWETSPTFSDSESVEVFGGTESIAPDFANYNPGVGVPGSVSGVVWNDLDGNGVRAATETGLAGWAVFVDLNADGALDVGEPTMLTDTAGAYTFTGVNPGSVTIVTQVMPGWRATAPLSGVRTFALRSSGNVVGIDFGNVELRDAAISGTVYVDSDQDGTRDAGERGLAGITVYLDINGDAILDAGEPSMVTSGDLFYTPGVDEAGTYSFSHLAKGTYIVRQIVPDTLSATPAAQRERSVTLVGAENHPGIDFGAVYRPSEIRGVKFDDRDGDHLRDADEPGVGGVTIFVDLDRDDVYDAGEPTAITAGDGSYAFTNMSPGAYIIREIVSPGYEHTYPNTVGGILWPSGTSNPAVGNVTPLGITTSLVNGQSHFETVSITLPTAGALTNLVDVFLLFDDTGSFVNNSPIVRAAFPAIISQLQTSLPGIDLGFGVGRFEEYANFASEYATGRPFVLNQPIVAASTPGYLTSIQAALDRTTPGYGGDQPETVIEALYQVVTGRGFDGNNNGSVLDSGLAGLAATQLNPGSSGDVPSFASFTPDAAHSVLPAAGSVGGAGFRAGALPIILTATDTGFAYQPNGEATITGLGGVTLPVSSLTQTSRGTTPFNSGARIQETITGLNALGALVIGLGTNPQATLDPRQGLEAISKLTGATNQSATTIANGTTDPIAPGDPLYFQIATGFAASVASGVVSAIQNAVTNVAVNITVQASDPRVHIVNHSGTRSGVGAGQTATFDIEFVGDGRPHRFDLQFVRAGTNVVLGSIPVVLGTPVPGDGYDYEDLDEGEIETEVHFGSHLTSSAPINVAPSFTAGANALVLEDAGAQATANWATAILAGPASEAGQSVQFLTSTDHPELFSVLPTISPDGTLTFTPAANAFGTATVTVQLRDDGGTANGGSDTSPARILTIAITPVNDAPAAVDDAYEMDEDGVLDVLASGVLANDTDIEGATLTAAVVTPPERGVLGLNNDGSFTYTPAANYHGTDTFTYQASDGTDASNVATVTITVKPANDPPAAVDDAYATPEDALLVVDIGGVLANDSDTDGDVLSVTLVDRPAHGDVILGSDGLFTYAPVANYHGPDSFTYRVSDGSTFSNLATVTIEVHAVNDAPTAADDAFAITEDVTLIVPALGVLANDHDIDGDPLTAEPITGPSHGTLVLDPSGSLVYKPAANFNGTDSFTYRTSDGALGSSAATVTINIAAANDAPVAQDDKYSVNQGATLIVSAAVGVLGNDSDIDGDPLAAMLVDSPANGLVVLNTNGTFSYTPAATFTGQDRFTYRADDGLLASNIATVTIDVLPVASGGTKFIVVDGSVRDAFNYDADGQLVDNHPLDQHDKGPRGVAANRDGSLYWIVDRKGEVFVYDQSGSQVGAWRFRGIDQPEGIATDGTNIWIVDRNDSRIYYFAGAAAVRGGTLSPTWSFKLDRRNRDATDVTTDGAHLWVVDDTPSVDKVFRYSTSGKLEGIWAIDPRNRRPTGLTIDPNDVNDIWIVDAWTDRVYRYAGAAWRDHGGQCATDTFDLAGRNRNPQGIADPLPREANVITSTILPHAGATTKNPITAGEDRGAPLTADPARRDESVEIASRNAKAVRGLGTNSHAHDAALLGLLDDFDTDSSWNSLVGNLGKCRGKRVAR